MTLGMVIHWMGHMKPVARLDDSDTHCRGSRQRPDGQSHVQAEVAIARTEVDKVAHTHGDDTTHGHDGQQASRDVEDGGESHGDTAAAMAYSQYS